MKIFILILFFLIVASILFYLRNPEVQYISRSSTPTPIKKVNYVYAFPIDNFFQRLSKKPFGINITPKTSPIQPEKFTGFHTGVDIEYGDITSDTNVFAITNGQIIYSDSVSGYGGLLAIQHTDFISVYGHLNPTSLTQLNMVVKKGQKIGILGNSYSPQTDGERKHLHFGIVKGNQLDFRGYVQDRSELSTWLDPVTLYQ